MRCSIHQMDFSGSFLNIMFNRLNTVFVLELDYVSCNLG